MARQNKMPWWSESLLEHRAESVQDRADCLEAGRRDAGYATDALQDDRYPARLGAFQVCSGTLGSLSHLRL